MENVCGECWGVYRAENGGGNVVPGVKTAAKTGVKD